MAQFIINKSRTACYNVDRISNLYVQEVTASVNVRGAGGDSGGLIGKYDSFEDARTALMIIMKMIPNNTLIYAPTNEQVSLERNRPEQMHQNGWHGQKPIRHGGS